jgi:site-specific DNA recombinase
MNGCLLWYCEMRVLLAAVSAGGVVIVYADAMDRLSRSQADIRHLFDGLLFHGIMLAAHKKRRRDRCISV